MTPPKVVSVFGTTHELQREGCESAEFPQRLEHEVRRRRATIIIEEWKIGENNTVGKQIADKLGIDWCNADTPLTEPYETFDPSPLWLDCGCVTHRDYGPIEHQILREEWMIARISEAMVMHEASVFVCGIAHLQSISEKLHRSGFDVKGLCHITLC